MTELRVECCSWLNKQTINYTLRLKMTEIYIAVGKKKQVEVIKEMNNQ